MALIQNHSVFKIVHVLGLLPNKPLLHLPLHISHNIFFGSTDIILFLPFSKITINDGLNRQSILINVSLLFQIHYQIFSLVLHQ